MTVWNGDPNKDVPHLPLEKGTVIQIDNDPTDGIWRVMVYEQDLKAAEDSGEFYASLEGIGQMLGREVSEALIYPGAELTVGTPGPVRVCGVNSPWKGIHAGRFDREPLEMRFASEFQTICSGERPSLLDNILSVDNVRPEYCSDRDRTVACTVIQWLGSSVGQAFLQKLMRV